MQTAKSRSLEFIMIVRLGNLTGISAARQIFGATETRVFETSRNFVVYDTLRSLLIYVGSANQILEGGAD